MNEDFVFGFIIGGAVVATAFAIALVVTSSREDSGYRDKMVIKYHCPEKEYERKIFLEMVNGSGIQSNFVDKEYSMDKHRIRYRLTNPK